MSNYINDLGSYITAGGVNAGSKAKQSKSDMGLNMTDFLVLMLAQFQNQSIDDTADTSEMLNQLVQMQMIQALTNMTDASLMSYAASLVGKEVTIGLYDDKGVLHEVVGTVTATGTYGGEQVVFVGDTYYTMSQILAVGRLPERAPVDPPDEGGDSSQPDEGEDSSSQTDPTQTL
ncbi:MAG: hypothetical protein HFH02_12995 [Dorea sp.]|nr:hypothetical protein [Dorea sp.]